MKTNNTLSGAVATLALACGMAQVATAQDDHGDTAEEATLLAIGGAVGGMLDNDRDTDYFRLDLVGLAVVQVRTSGQTDTKGELLDATGGRLASDDDNGPGDNFDIEIELEPGVYYVAVSGQAGGYAISARLGGARDHGDTRRESTLLRLHTPEDLASVSPSVLLATAGRIHPDTVDTDVFRIDVAEDGTDVVLRTSPSGFVTYGVLTDARGNQIVADERGYGGFQLVAPLGRGVYYVSVTGIEVGAYRILAQAMPRTYHDHGSFFDWRSSGGLGPEMVVVPAGSFLMGCSDHDRDCSSAEFPVHRVDVERFALAKHEVTFGQWDECHDAGWCSSNPRAGLARPPGDNHPVAYISFPAGREYAEWLSHETGETYHLPSEAQWEYAARAGTRTKYYWGNELSGGHANCHLCGDNFSDTSPVGSFRANPWGFHDMLGNVEEWTLDCKTSSYHGAPIDDRPWITNECRREPPHSQWRVQRGGTYNSLDVRVSDRDAYVADRSAGVSALGRRGFGLRVARVILD